MDPRPATRNEPQPKKSRSKVEAALEQACSDLLSYDNWRPLKTDPQSERGFARRILGKIASHPVLYSFIDLIRSVLASCTRDSGFGETGMPDRQYIRYLYGDLDFCNLRYDRTPSIHAARALTQTMWIEWKAPGEKLKDHQELWHRDERLRGALTVKAGVDFPATIDGFLTWYRTSGLMRRKL